MPFIIIGYVLMSAITTGIFLWVKKREYPNLTIDTLDIIFGVFFGLFWFIVLPFAILGGLGYLVFRIISKCEAFTDKWY